MTGQEDVLDYLLAEALGMSLGQVRGLPNSEREEWKAFYEYRSSMRDFQRRSNGG